MSSTSSAGRAFEAPLRLVGSVIALGGAWWLAAGPTPGPGEFPWGAVLSILLGAILFGVSAGQGPDTGATPMGPPLRNLGGARAWWVAGAVLLLSLLTAYAALGWSAGLPVLWIGAMLAATRAVWPLRSPVSPDERVGGREYIILLLIIVALGVFVLPELGHMPWEISTDEIYFTRNVRDFASGRARDAFGLSEWWGLPAFHFAAVAWFTPFTGTSIEGMRAVSAAVALLTPIPVYMWTRALWGRRVAMIAVGLLAFGHVFIGWGRIALHQNAALFTFAVALALLGRGLRLGCPVRLLWGGIALGAGFLTYPSAQIGIVIWIGALVTMMLAGSLGRHDAVRTAALTGAGFFLCAAPVLVHAVLDFALFAQRAQAVAITNPAVLDQLGTQWGLDGAAVILENIKRGLLGLNASYPYVTYYNPGHAFLDPVTGGLVWLGVALAVRRLRHPGWAIALPGLLAVLAATALTEGAPVHGRLLVALPFIAVFAAVALDGVLRAVPTVPRAGAAAVAAPALAVAGIAILNLAIHRDFVTNQLATGRNDAVTAIGRTLGVGVELEGPLERFFGQGARWDPRHHVYFVSDEGGPLFRWAASPDWHDWIAFFSDSALVHEAPTVAAFLAEGGSPGQGLWNRITLFLPTAAWTANQAVLRARYPDLTRRTITPNRRLTAVEIQR